MTLNFVTLTTDMRDDMLENTHNPKRLRRYHVKVLGMRSSKKTALRSAFSATP